jgi:hypothetical protein
MAFSPECINAVKPVVYIVERFWEPPNPQTPLGLRSYPPEVVESFLATMRANLALINIGTSKTPREKWSVPLFQLRTVATIEDVPKLPPGGDVVLGFMHFPDLYQLAVDPGRPPETIDSLPAEKLSASMDRLVQRFYDAMTAKWEKLVTELLSKRQRAAPSGTVGTSYIKRHDYKVHLKAGGKEKKVVYTQRYGLIDVAHPAVDSLSVWSEGSQRAAMLSALFNADLRLGPAVVAKVGKADAGGPAYLRAVGRGLAYNLLHEFWHAARGSGDHPLGEQGNTMIEQQPSPTKEGLKLDPLSIAAIQDHYEATWGRDIAEKKVELGALPD